jgi:hypothetical protein
MPKELLEDERVRAVVEFHHPTIVNIGAVTGTTADSFEVLERILDEAGASAIRFERKDGLLDFYRPEVPDQDAMRSGSGERADAQGHAARVRGSGRPGRDRARLPPK